MSTYKEIIDRVNPVKPNQIPERTKLNWLTALDGRIAAEVFLMDIAEVRKLPHSYPDAMKAEPLVSFPHNELYDAYLEAMIDYTNGDYSDYQNCMERYNQLFSSFHLWYLNTYDPAQREHRAPTPYRPESS